MGEVLKEGVENVPRVGDFRLKVSSASHHVSDYMAFHQGDIGFKIQDQERPGISEGKV